MPDINETILNHVNAPNYRPVKPKVIAKQLGFEPDNLSRLKRAIKQLVKEGKLVYGPSHLICPIAKGHPATKVAKPAKEKPAKEKSAKSSKHVVGTFRRAQGGFGFVRPEGTAKVDGRDADIFIPVSSTGDAANGDTVRVRITDKKDRMGKISGRIIDIVERATNRFVGTYLEKGGMGLVQIDGKIFTEPVFVGDPGAKGAQPDDKVVLEMVRFPSHVRDGEGVILDILGQRGTPGVDTLSIIHEFDLPGEFDEAALENARQEAEKFDESIGSRRKDLTQETVITIDPATASGTIGVYLVGSLIVFVGCIIWQFSLLWICKMKVPQFSIISYFRDYWLRVYPLLFATSSEAIATPLNLYLTKRFAPWVREMPRRLVIGMGSFLNINGTLMCVYVFVGLVAALMGLPLSLLELLALTPVIFLISYAVPGIPGELVLFAGPILMILGLSPEASATFLALYVGLQLGLPDSVRTGNNSTDDFLCAVLLNEYYIKNIESKQIAEGTLEEAEGVAAPAPARVSLPRGLGL